MTDRFLKHACVTAAMTAMLASAARAQVSLSSAVDLALRNSPKVRMAQAEVAKAKAVYSETRDVYIPAVTTSGGDGASTGVPLSVPVVFSIQAQSLVFNFSQRDNMRAANEGITGAEYSLTQVQNDIAEDTASTYVALDNALQRKRVTDEAMHAAQRLTQIVQDRFDAGADAHIDVSRAKETEAQYELQMVLIENEIANLTAHLGRLTGIGISGGFTTVHSSIPEIAMPAENVTFTTDSPGVAASEAAARAKALTAHGEARYRWRPQFAFEANYSRITTVGNSYALYYPGFSEARDHSFNSLGIGVQITVPLLDYLHEAKARESRAEADRALFEAQVHKLDFEEGRGKLQNSVKELAAREKVARYARDIANDELDAVRIQLQPSAGASGGTQMTPKDEQNAVISQQQKTLDLLNVEMQLSQTEISLMEQTGTLTEWLHQALPSSHNDVVPATPQPK